MEPGLFTASAPQTETRMDNSLEAEEDVSGEADWDSSPFLCPEKEQMKSGSFRLPEDPSSKGSSSSRDSSHFQTGPWSQRSQRSISRSLQRAEVLLRSTFHPSLRWLFRSHSQDEEEEHFVVAHNLVSRSSARLLRLQQVLLTVAPQGRLPGDTQGHGSALWRLVLQRSLLLFTHEFTRRARLAAGFVCRLERLLPRQTASMLSSVGTELSSLCQELRVHLNHWSRLFSRVQSDAVLRLALADRAALLTAIRQTLDCLGLQALVLTERCVSSALSAVAVVDLDSVAPKVLEDILTGTDLYNQAVEDQRAQQSIFQLRAAALRQAHHPRWACRLAKTHDLHPSAFSVHDLLRILAVRHAETAAKQLHGWVSQQHRQQAAGRRPDAAGTWEQQAVLFLSPLRSDSRAALHSSCCQTCSQTHAADTPGSEPGAERSGSGAGPSQLSCSGVDVQQRSAGPQVCRAETLFQLLLSSNDRLAHRRPPPDDTDPDPPGISAAGPKPSREGEQEGAESEAAGSEVRESCCVQDCPPPEDLDCARWPHSVQWSDLGRSLALDQLMDRYRSEFRSLCRDAVWLRLLVPPAGGAAGSINLQGLARGVLTLRSVRQAPHSGQVSEECEAVLQDLSEYLLVVTAHTHWDHVLCRSLGSALKDKCESDQNRTLPETTSVSMERFLHLPPPLHTALSSQPPDGPAGRPGTTHTVSLALASVQLSTVWVMSKAFQFLSSWNLKKFLLVTQGDLKMLRKSSQLLLHQTRAVVLSSGGENHARRLLRLQLGELDRAVSELQTFSARVLRSFSADCKRMSGEIFQRTMPSAVHWRPGQRTGFPSSPSEYASLAAQTVIGQVLEGVAPLPDDVRVQALSITMTAFMEAWMEHILQQKIKFSVQGALQLKQDFDCIREMIQADQYGLSAELHQRLLSLRVFQQVDSAVVCLLQQPQAKSYLHSRAWEPLTHCCPSAGSRDRRDSLDAAVSSSSITNLHCVEGAEPPADLPAVAPSTPAEPYLAPSVSLGAVQQQWLDLRIQNSRRWRLPGLQCLSTSES